MLGRPWLLRVIRRAFRLHKRVKLFLAKYPLEFPHKKDDQDSTQPHPCGIHKVSWRLFFFFFIDMRCNFTSSSNESSEKYRDRIRLFQRAARQAADQGREAEPKADGHGRGRLYGGALRAPTRRRGSCAGTKRRARERQTASPPRQACLGEPSQRARGRFSKRRSRKPNDEIPHTARVGSPWSTATPPN